MIIDSNSTTTDKEVCVPTYLLIHGASHGAWCWEKLITLLKEKGYKAYALDLPGSGSDPTPRKDLTLQSYIDAVGDFITSNNLKNITLVGHSLAGIILPNICLEHSDRIKEVIFLAALVLNKGECALDLIPVERQGVYIEMAKDSPDNTFITDKEGAKKRFFSDIKDEEAEYYYSKLTRQSLNVYLEPTNITPSFNKNVIVRYILCTEDKTLPASLCSACSKKLNVKYETLSTGHDPMLSAPVELLNLILKDR